MDHLTHFWDFLWYLPVTIFAAYLAILGVIALTHWSVVDILLGWMEIYLVVSIFIGAVIIYAPMLIPIIAWGLILSSNNLPAMILGWLIFGAGICKLLHYFRLMGYMSKSFGHGKVFGVGLIIAPYLFMPILAFGKSEYLGSGAKLKKQEKAAKRERVAEIE